jgi:hypothetical protein
MPAPRLRSYSVLPRSAADDQLARVGIFTDREAPPLAAWNDPAPDDTQAADSPDLIDRAYQDDAK